MKGLFTKVTIGGLMAIFVSCAIAQATLPTPQTESQLQQIAEANTQSDAKKKDPTDVFVLPKPVTSKRAAAGYKEQTASFKTKSHRQQNSSLPSPAITLLQLQSDKSKQQRYRQLKIRLGEELKELAKENLPSPKKLPHAPLHLSMREAILLALRNQPAVVNAELQRVADKFALIEAHWSTWEPKYVLSGSVGMGTGTQTSYGLGEASVAVNTPIGTSIKYSYSHANLFAKGNQGRSTFTVDQPLLRGFGWAVNTSAWYDALDAEENAKLAYKSAIITAVVGVITDYRALISAYQQLDVSKVQLDATKQTLDQAKLKLKAGQIAKSDYIQLQSNYKQQQVTYISQQSSIFTAYAALLNDLGLDADAKVIINKKIRLSNKYIPKVNRAVQLALLGNINYQTQLINLRATERALVNAKNAALWKLDAGYTSNLGGPIAATGNPAVLLTWSIPINAVNLQKGILDARIALEQAKNSLVQTRLALVRTVKTAIITLQNDWQGVLTSRETVDLQNQTVSNIRLKIKYGQSTVFELNTEQDTLISDQTSLITSEISFMNDLTTLYQTLGLTLDIWHIKLRY